MKDKSSKHYFDLTKKLLGGKINWKDHITQIEALTDLINFHEWRYYVKNDPLISDFEYDLLFKQLEQVERTYPHLIRPDSPTQRVSPDLNQDFPPVQHLSPMLSLANSYNEEDLLEFDKQIRKLNKFDPSDTIEYCVEPKFDGGSITVIYENDILVRAATRGNGTLGEEITPNVKALRSVPLSALFSKKGIARIELRGEAMIRKDHFEEINLHRRKSGGQEFANPRNAAAGGLRMKNPKETAQRKIIAFIYQIAIAENSQGDIISPFDTHGNGIDYLHDMGFLVPHREKKVCTNIQEVITYCNLWQEERDEYPYEIDGMVIKVNSLATQRNSGSTSHHPRWAIAYKFKAKQGTTKLINVEFQVGKIGSITPVAKLEPISLAGVTISSVSLHNEDFVDSKDIRIGDQVLVERAGDVIPYIVKSLPELRTGSEKKIEFPKTCPVCDTVLVKKEKEAAWRCSNYHCEAQVLQRLVHHVSKDAMDIEGLGPSIISRFYHLGWLRSIAEIYRFDFGPLTELEGFGKKSADNLESSIQKAKARPIHRFLYSLSIHHLGKRAAKILSEQVDHILDIQKLSVDDLKAIKDIGPVLAENIVAFFSSPENLKLILELESLGVNMSSTKEDKPSLPHSNSPLNGKSILFTGSLETMTRKEAQVLAERRGARNISAVSKNLDILVAGKSAGSKLKKAMEIDTIEIIREDEFLKRVNSL